VLHLLAPWSEQEWDFARTACELRNSYLLPEYTLLSFAAMVLRVRYVAANEQERGDMLSEVRSAGGVTADNGRWIEVMT
jgi:hypothetical protein